MKKAAPAKPIKATPAKNGKASVKVVEEEEDDEDDDGKYQWHHAPSQGLLKSTRQPPLKKNKTLNIFMSFVVPF